MIDLEIPGRKNDGVERSDANSSTMVTPSRLNTTIFADQTHRWQNGHCGKYFEIADRAGSRHADERMIHFFMPEAAFIRSRNKVIIDPTTAL